MIRVVLDTNILVSALLQPLGPSAQLLVLGLNGSLQLCISGNIYAEYVGSSFKISIRTESRSGPVTLIIAAKFFVIHGTVAASMPFMILH